MTQYFGDFAEDATVYIPFNTFDSNDPSASVTITNLADADIHVHKDAGLTQIVTDGATISIDFDTITGNHIATIDTSAHADYATGSDYMVRIEGTTVDGATINAWIGTFSIENRFSAGALRPTTAGRTLDVTITGAAGIDWGNVENPTTTVDLSATDIQLADTVTTLTNKTGFSLSATGLDLITSTATGVVEIAKAVWDRVLTGGTHNINNSAGKRLRGVSGIIFSDGTAQSGGANSIQLASGAITTDDMFVRAKVIIVGGTGAGQEAIITDSVASTDTLTITPAWLDNPDATSEYEVLPAQVHATVRNGGYDNGFVYVDIANGSAGTTKGVNGTSTNKSSVLADARTIADQESIRRFDIEGGAAFSLDQSYTDWIFEHVSASFITLNSQDVTGSVFMRSGITGVGTNTDITTFELCGLTNVTIGLMSAIECVLEGTLTLANTGQHLALGCSQNGSAVPVLDVNGDGVTETGVQLSDYSGTLDIRGMTSVDTVVITGDAHVSINADCTGGTITYAGDIKITDNAGGAVTEVQGLTSDILDDTVEIGTAGAGLTDLGGMSTGMITEIKAAVLPTQNTAFNNIMFLFVAASDGVTPVTGATGTSISRSIDGSAFGSGTGTLAEVANGIYQYDASAADMNGGVITFRFVATGGTPGAANDTFVTIVTSGGV